MNIDNFDKKIKDIKFARFLGGFISEGNLTETGSMKITNASLEFIGHLVNCATNLFGNDIVTAKPPTLEHPGDESRFAYHKYFSASFGRFLMNDVGIKPGKRILNDDPLPKYILSWRYEKDFGSFKEWIKNYLQSRFSGDGWVHLEKKWVGITKAKAIALNPSLKNELSHLYSKGKKVKNYPKDFVEKLKQEARKEINFPKELVQLEDILNKDFDIVSTVKSVGIRTIYFDKKRKFIIVSGVYHLLVTRRGIEKFKREINFLEFDARNKERLNSII